MDRSPRKSSRATAGELQALDRLCDAFEAAWRGSEPPRIEEFLAGCPEHSREALLAELLSLELEYRRERGETANQAEYRTRFPEFGRVVSAAFADRKARTDTKDAARAEAETHPESTQQIEPTISTRLGEYELQQVLGRGGMGVVYRAYHTRLKRVVALKMLPTEQLGNAAAVGRFEREMAALGQLSHPNIVVAHDAGEVDGTHYLVMEFVEGEDLGSLLARIGPLPIAEACEVTRQTAVALQYAHEQGLVHRDVKPSNLMLTRAGVVKVLDLGLARLSGDLARELSEITNTGQIMGTLDYIAPEQVNDSHLVDIRADVYSLGATFYKLLTGRAPLAAEERTSLTQQLLALATVEPTPIETLRPEVPEEVAAVVRTCLAKDPAGRFAAPAELAAALAGPASGSDLSRLFDAAGGDGTPVARISNARQVRPTSARRRRWPWGALAGTAAVACLSVAVWLSWLTKAAPQPDQLLVRVERAGKLFVEEDFPRALPVRLGDELRIVADLPAGLRPSVWGVDSAGKLHDFSECDIKTTPRGSEVVYPAGAHTLPVDDQTGTEFILVCGEREGEAGVETVRAAVAEVLQGHPLPAGLPRNVLVVVSRDQVQVRTATGDVPRGFGELQGNALLQVEERLDQLRLRLHEQYPFIAAVAFAHEP